MSPHAFAGVRQAGLYVAVTTAVLSLGLIALLACAGQTPAEGTIRTTVAGDGSGVREQTTTIPEETLGELRGGIPALVKVLRGVAPPFATVEQTASRAVTVRIPFKASSEMVGRLRQLTGTNGPSMLVQGTPFSRSVTYTEAADLRAELQWIENAVLASSLLSDDAKSRITSGTQRTLGSVSATVALPDGRVQRMSEGQRVTSSVIYPVARVLVASVLEPASVTRNVTLELESAAYEGLLRDNDRSTVAGFIRGLIPGSEPTFGGGRISVDMAKSAPDVVPAATLFRAQTRSFVRDEHALGDVRVYSERLSLSDALGVVPQQLVYQLTTEKSLDYTPGRPLHGNGTRRIVKTSGADGGSTTVSGNTIEVRSNGGATITVYARVIIETATAPTAVPTQAYAAGTAALFAISALLLIIVRRGLTRARLSPIRAALVGVFWGLAVVGLAGTVALALGPDLASYSELRDSDLGDAFRASSREAWRTVPLLAAALMSGIPTTLEASGTAEGAALEWGTHVAGVAGLALLAAIAIYLIFGAARRGLRLAEVVALCLGYAAVNVAAIAVTTLLLPTTEYVVMNDTVLRLALSPRFDMGPALATPLALAVIAAVAAHGLPLELDRQRTTGKVISAACRGTIVGIGVAALAFVSLVAIDGTTSGVVVAGAPNLVIAAAAAALGDHAPFEIGGGVMPGVQSFLWLVCGVIVAATAGEVTHRSRKDKAANVTLPAVLAVFATYVTASYLMSLDVRVADTEGALKGLVLVANIDPLLASALVALAAGGWVFARWWFVGGRELSAMSLVREQPHVPAALTRAAGDMLHGIEPLLERIRPRTSQSVLAVTCAGLVMVLVGLSLPIISFKVLGFPVPLSAHDLGGALGLVGAWADFAVQAASASSTTTPIPAEVRDAISAADLYGPIVRALPYLVILAGVVTAFGYTRAARMPLATRAALAVGVTAVGLAVIATVVYFSRVTGVVADANKAAGPLAQMISNPTGAFFGTAPFGRGTGLGGGPIASANVIESSLQSGVVFLVAGGAVLLLAAWSARRVNGPSVSLTFTKSIGTASAVGAMVALVLVFLPWQRVSLELGALNALIGAANALGGRVPALPDISGTQLGFQGGVFGMLYVAIVSGALWLHFFGARYESTYGLQPYALPAAGLMVGAGALLVSPGELKRNVIGQTELQQVASLASSFGGADVSKIFSGLVKTEMTIVYYSFIAAAAAMALPAIDLFRLRDRFATTQASPQAPVTGAQLLTTTPMPIAASAAAATPQSASRAAGATVATQAAVGTTVSLGVSAAQLTRVWRCLRCDGGVVAGSTSCAACGADLR